MARLRNLTLEHVVMFALVIAGLAISAAPIGDNSLLVHIRTGAEIVDDWSIPKVDPYSFTAVGEPWIVQSWLPGLIYGLLDSAYLIIVLHCLISASAALVMVLLARAGSMLRTLASGGIPVAIAFLTWTPRPLLFAILCFALTIYIAVRRRSLWWLLPIVWIWVNSHGSWPIGIAWLTAFAIGERIDRGLFDRRTLRYCAAFIVGVIFGAINPLGPRLLGFFTTAIGERSEIFSQIAEWQSPDFHGGTGIALAVAIALALAVCLTQRAPWRLSLPVLGLLVASLYSTRNMAMLAVALAPLLGAVLQTYSSGVADKSGASPRDVRVAVTAFVVLVFVGSAIFARPMLGAAYDFDDYPIAALDRLRDERQVDGARIASRETVGCYLIWRDGDEASVFVDDRFDMYRPEVLDDYSKLLGVDEDPQPILDHYRIDYVVWDSDDGLTQVLDADTRWQQLFEVDDWTVFART